MLIYYHCACCLATNSVGQHDSSVADLFTCKMASTCDNNLRQTFTAEEVAGMFSRDNLVTGNENDVDSENQGMSSGEESELDHQLLNENEEDEEEGETR